MSRLLFINKNKRFDIESALRTFAELSENNPTPEGTWQGDGWGIAWIDVYLKWREYKNFLPIWKNTDFFHIFMPSNTFILHVRTLAKTEEYVSEEHNMPYSTKDLVFAFDGDPMSAENINTQYIENLWDQIKQLNRENIGSTFKALCEGIDLEKENLKASNLVLCDKNNVFVYSKYKTEFEKYYQLSYSMDDNRIIFSSHEINPDIDIEGIQNWQKLGNGEFMQVKLFENKTE